MRAARVVSGVAVVMLVMAACRSGHPGRTSSGARASCAADAECVVTAGTGCCQACPDEPSAIPRLALEQQQNRCSKVDCAPVSDRVECRKVASSAAYVARCSDGTCAAVPR